jgi:D-xylose transport system substrate-binding protein
MLVQPVLQEDPMRRNLAVLSIAAVFAAWGCGGGSGPAEKAAAKKGPEAVKVGLLLDNLHERWSRDRDMIQEVVTDMGGELLVATAEGDQAKQIQQAEKMIADGAKALIVVAHDTANSSALVDKAGAAKVPVIAYDRLVRDADVDLYIGFDIPKIGELQAQHLLAHAPKGNYILIGGSPTDGNAKLLREGQMKVLGPEVKKGVIKIVADGWATDWSAEAAAKIAEQGLDKAKNQVAAIVASNDVTAGGAIGVLEARGLAGKVAVSGQDAELDAAKRIVAGTQTMTIYKSLRTLTRLAARSAVLMAKGEKVDTSATVNNGKRDVPTMLFDPIAVNAENLDGILIADGFLKRADVYGK